MSASQGEAGSGHDRATPIAVTGMGCRLPGCDSPDSYWEMILRGECRVAPAPEERFDRSLYYKAGERKNRSRSYTDLACTVDYEAVEEERLRLPGDLRLCPELAFTSLLLAARQATTAVDGARQPLPERTGVYVGHTRKSGLAGRMIVGTYLPVLTEMLQKVEGLTDDQRSQVAEELRYRFRDASPRRDAAGGPDLASLTAATLVSQGLGVAGPAMVFNSACASSLNALAQAVRALQLGEIDAAVVGSASYFHQDTLVLFSHAQSLSERGSRPFDADADGIVVGEGYAAIVLRREEDAVREGLNRHAVIRGVGIASDGKGKSLWAPRAEGQRLAVQRAYAAIDDNEAPDYIEAHATGTQLGDATELKAIAECLAERDSLERITVGSVKSNIGHTLETAGMAGLIKAVLAVEKGVVPPTAGVRRLSPKIDWGEAALDVATEVRPWPAVRAGRARRVALNAFGIGGLNVHVVIDQATPRRATAEPRPHVHRKTEEPLAIVGAGVIAAGCLSVDAFWQRLSAGEAALSLGDGREARATLAEGLSTGCWTTPTTRGGYVTDFDYDWKRRRIPPKQIANSSPLQFMILQAVEDALVQLFGEAFEEPLRRLSERTGVVVGSMFGGDFANQLLMGLRLPEFERAIEQTLAAIGADNPEGASKQFREVLLARMPALLDETGSFTSSSLVSRLTKSFNLMGGGVAIDAGLCSGAAALACAADLLRAGDTDMMICVGAQEDMTPTRFEALNLTGHLAADGRAGEGQPGILPGEGCVALLIQRLDDAVRSGHKVLGTVGQVRGKIGPRPAAPMASTAAQSTLGHTLGASSHFELLSALEPSADNCESFTLRSRDFSGLNYRVEVAGPGVAARSSRSATLSEKQDSQGPNVVADKDLRLAGTGGLGEIGKLGAFLPPADMGSARLRFSEAERLAAAVSVPSPNQPNGTSRGYPTNGEPQPRHLKPIIDLSPSVMETHPENDSLFFDATQRRKNRLREQAAVRSASPTTSDACTEPYSDAPAPAARPVVPIHGVQAAGATNGHAPATEGFEPPVVPATVPLSTPSQPPAPRVAGVRPVSADELRGVMIEFVVDQTGYPPEEVGMDADLEADLGIDSIKKAQLLGELADAYGLSQDNSTSLDDLNDLQSILDLALGQLGSVADTSPAPIRPAPSPPTKQTPEVHGSGGPAANGFVPPVPTAPEPIASATFTPPAPFTPAVAGPKTANPVPTPPPASHTPPQANGVPTGGPDVGELRQRLVEFVVEQTGYPPEDVEMDTDLEADLGIDSIKKGQLLAELQEVYGFATRDDLTLDDFPDLATIQQFVIESGRPASLS